MKFKYVNGQVPSRLPRGASNKFTQNLNSCLSNYRNKNISKFDLKFMTKKNPTEFLNFEDRGYPAFINKELQRDNTSLQKIYDTFLV